MSSNKRNYFLNLLSNSGSLIGSLIVGFILPPLSLGYFDVERYGIWVLVTSISAILSISNFGIDGALSVYLAKAKNNEERNRLFESGLSFLIRVILVLISVLILIRVFPVIHFYQIIGNFSPKLIHEVEDALFYYMIFFAINLPFLAFSGGLSGIQKQYLDNALKIVQGFGSLVALAITFILKGNLVTFSLVLGAFNLLINIIRAIIFNIEFSKMQCKISISFSKKSVELENQIGRQLIRSGIGFSVYGLCVLLISTADGFIISHMLQAKDVTPFSIALRVINLGFSAVMLVNNSLAPIIGKTIGEGDIPKLNNLFHTMKSCISLLSMSILFGMILFYSDFARAWVGSKGSLAQTSVIVLAFFGFSYSIVNFTNVYIYGFGKTRLIALVGLLEATLHIIFSFIFIQLWGIIGIAVSSLSSSLLSSFWMNFVVLNIVSGKNINLFDRGHKFLLRTFILLAGILSLALLDSYFHIYLPYKIIIFGVFALIGFLTYKKEVVNLLSYFLRKQA